MTPQAPLWEDREDLLVRFLLGALSADEQDEIEARVFMEDDFLEEVMAAGDDLIHAYLTDSLSPEDRARFETHFLASPMRRHRFELVRAIAVTARGASGRAATGDGRTSSRTRALAWWLAAAALALALAAGLLG